jgi:hypothetical protein
MNAFDVTLPLSTFGAVLAVGVAVFSGLVVLAVRWGRLEGGDQPRAEGHWFDFVVLAFFVGVGSVAMHYQSRQVDVLGELPELFRATLGGAAGAGLWVFGVRVLRSGGVEHPGRRVALLLVLPIGLFAALHAAGSIVSGVLFIIHPERLARLQGGVGVVIAASVLLDALGLLLTLRVIAWAVRRPARAVRQSPVLRRLAEDDPLSPEE